MARTNNTASKMNSSHTGNGSPMLESLEGRRMFCTVIVGNITNFDAHQAVSLNESSQPSSEVTGQDEGPVGGVKAERAAATSTQSVSATDAATFSSVQIG